MTTPAGSPELNRARADPGGRLAHLDGSFRRPRLNAPPFGRSPGEGLSTRAGRRRNPARDVRRLEEGLTRGSRVRGTGPRVSHSPGESSWGCPLPGRYDSYPHRRGANNARRSLGSPTGVRVECRNWARATHSPEWVASRPETRRDYRPSGCTGTSRGGRRSTDGRATQRALGGRGRPSPGEQQLHDVAHRNRGIRWATSCRGSSRSARDPTHAPARDRGPSSRRVRRASGALQEPRGGAHSCADPAGDRGGRGRFPL
jgi:hypothetical protein